MKLPVTYNSGSNTILVTGYSEATPCTFTNIYNADVAGSWGVVTRQCTKQFCFSAYLDIGDGSTTTWFADTKKQIFWTELGSTYAEYIKIYDGGHFRVGILVNASEKVTRDGCSMSFNASTMRKLINGMHINADIQLFSSSFTNYGASSFAVSSGYGSSLVIYNCILDWAALAGLVLDLYNVTMTGNTNYIALMNVTGPINILLLYGMDRPLYVPLNTNTTFKNIRCNDYTSLFTNSGSTLNIVNGTFDAWVFTWGGSSAIAYRKYEFDLKVKDENNNPINSAIVKTWDKNSALVVDTTSNASGVIATQTITRGYYNQSNGNTLQESAPHTMKLYKYGKHVLKSMFTIESIVDWSTTMYTDEHITQTNETTVAAYTGISVNHTTETITISTNHTLDEIYDYLQYDIKENPQLDIDEIVNTTDGINYVCEYDFNVNTGIVVTADDQRFTMVSGKTYVLTGTANFTGIIADQSKSRVFITIIVKDAKTKAPIQDCRVYIKTDPGGTELLKELTDSNGEIEKAYEHTTNIDITGVARKATNDPLYKTNDISGTITSNGFSTIIQLIGD